MIRLLMGVRIQRPAKFRETQVRAPPPRNRDAYSSTRSPSTYSITRYDQRQNLVFTEEALQAT